MNILYMQKKIDDLIIDGDIVDFVILSEEFFFINEIKLTPTNKNTIAAIDEIVNKNKSIEIKHLEDKTFHSSILFISCAGFFVNRFNDFITNLTKNSKLSYDEQNKLALEAIYRLDKNSKAYNINNRFSFSSKPILQLECEDGKITIDYNNLLLDNEQKNLLRELFTVRQEIFSELLNLTERYLIDLEYNSYKFSKIKMDAEKGKYLLHEFIIGISLNKELINAEKKQLEQLEKNLFRLFGLKPPKFGYLSDKIFKRDKPALGLQSLAKNIQDAAKQKKRIGKK